MKIKFSRSPRTVAIIIDIFSLKANKLNHSLNVLNKYYLSVLFLGKFNGLREIYLHDELTLSLRAV